MAIQFRDRALKEGETSHYYCDECGEELHPDGAYTHKCSPLKNLFKDETWKRFKDEGWRNR